MKIKPRLGLISLFLIILFGYWFRHLKVRKPEIANSEFSSFWSDSIPNVEIANLTGLKTILYWNEFYGRYDTFDFGYGHKAFNENNCPISNCFATKNRDLLSIDKYDAIIVNIKGLPNDWPASRSSKTRFVMLAIESPDSLSEYKKLESKQFNWTMTYRTDSDFPIPYANLVLTDTLPENLDDFIANFGSSNEATEPKGEGFAVIYMEDCSSFSGFRESYIRNLSRTIPIDVYGECGSFPCKSGSLSSCIKKGSYKFFLSFEKSFCKDYVTDSFYGALDLDMIPVVLGGGNYSAIAPKMSYIDASEFSRPELLGNFLKILDSNDKKYRRYFWWKSFYKKKFLQHRALCNLCQKLNSPSEPLQTYLDMHQWWVEKANCKSKS